MYQNKPVIGITPLYDDDKNSYWMLPGYMKALEEQNAITLMLPFSADAVALDYFLSACDGFLLAGGQDVDPMLYHTEKSPKCGTISPLRDQMDTYILTHAAQQDKAVLGICRGHQLMNVAYGGTLYQDLPSEHPSENTHQMQPPYDRCAHKVTIIPNTPLADILQLTECPVNSCHHQAIQALSPAFIPMATSPDGLVEAIYMPNHRFIWGIQWHPELSYQNSIQSQQIISAFLSAAKAL